MAREETAGILEAPPALEEALEEVPHHRDQGGGQAQDQGPEQGGEGQPQPESQGQAEGGRPRRGALDPRPGLARTQHRGQLGAAPAPAGEEGGDVGGPDEQEQKEDQGRPLGGGLMEVTDGEPGGVQDDQPRQQDPWVRAAGRDNLAQAEKAHRQQPPAEAGQGQHHHPTSGGQEELEQEQAHAEEGEIGQPRRRGGQAGQGRPFPARPQQDQAQGDGEGGPGQEQHHQDRRGGQEGGRDDPALQAGQGHGDPFRPGTRSDPGHGATPAPPRRRAPWPQPLARRSGQNAAGAGHNRRWLWRRPRPRSPAT